MCICMCMLNRRFQILFDKDLWNKLTKMAKSQNISFGEVIRRAVREYLDKQGKLQNLQRPTPFNRFFKIPAKKKKLL